MLPILAYTLGKEVAWSLISNNVYNSLVKPDRLKVLNGVFFQANRCCVYIQHFLPNALCVSSRPYTCDKCISLQSWVSLPLCSCGPKRYIVGLCIRTVICSFGHPILVNSTSQEQFIGNSSDWVHTST